MREATRPITPAMQEASWVPCGAFLATRREANSFNRGNEVAAEQRNEHYSILPRRVSSRVPAPGTRDEPLRTSTWEANISQASRCINK